MEKAYLCDAGGWSASKHLERNQLICGSEFTGKHGGWSNTHGWLTSKKHDCTSRKWWENQQRISTSWNMLKPYLSIEIATKWDIHTHFWTSDWWFVFTLPHLLVIEGTPHPKNYSKNSLAVRLLFVVQCSCGNSLFLKVVNRSQMR